MWNFVYKNQLSLVAGDVTAVQCYSCYHEENMNLLNVKEDDLDGVVYQAYRGIYIIIIAFDSWYGFK